MTEVQEMLDRDDVPGAVQYIQSLRDKESTLDEVRKDELESDDMFVSALLLSIKKPKAGARKLTYGVRSMTTYNRLFLLR